MENDPKLPVAAGLFEPVPFSVCVANVTQPKYYLLTNAALPFRTPSVCGHPCGGLFRFLTHPNHQAASDVWQVLSSSHVSSCVPDLLRSETPCLHGRFPWQTRCARALASRNKHIHFGYHWRKTFNAVRVYVDICGWGTGKFAHQGVYGRNLFLFQRPKHLHLPKTSGFWSLVTVAMEEVR